jgi:hypothetical protein
MPLTSNPQLTLVRWPEGRTPDLVRRWAECLVDARPGGAPGGPAVVARMQDVLDRELAGKQVAVLGRVDDPADDTRPWAAACVVQAAHPLTGSGGTSLSRLAADRPGALASLLRELRAGGLVEADVQAESEAGSGFRQQELAADGFRPVAWAMRRSNPAPARDAAPHAPAGVDVHPMRDDEQDFVYACVVTALRRGLGGDDSATDLAAWARRRFPLHGEDATCVVATVDGLPVAHGLAYPRTDPMATGRLAYVADVFVIPGQQRRGYSHVVSQALLHALALKGFDEVESDVAAGPDSELLRRRLADAGWQEWRIRWR